MAKSDFSDEVVQSLVGKLEKFAQTLPDPEQQLLHHLIEAATTLSDEQLEGAAGGAPGQPQGPALRGRAAAPGTPSAPQPPTQPGKDAADKIRRF